jgi:hypothetical protein
MKEMNQSVFSKSVLRPANYPGKTPGIRDRLVKILWRFAYTQQIILQNCKGLFVFCKHQPTLDEIKIKSIVQQWLITREF